MSSKTIKFASDLVPLILAGEKTSTWRLFDDKDLTIGDHILLQEFGKDEPFAEADITDIKVIKFGELTDQDKIGHETYGSDEEMYRVYSGYYGTKVDASSELKIIHFRLTDSGH